MIMITNSWKSFFVGCVVGIIISIIYLTICGCEGEPGSTGAIGPRGVQGQGQASIIQIASGTLLINDMIREGDTYYWKIKIEEQYVKYNRHITVSIWGVVPDDWFDLLYRSEYMVVQEYIYIFYGSEPDQFSKFITPDVTRYKVTVIM